MMNKHTVRTSIIPNYYYKREWEFDLSKHLELLEYEKGREIQTASLKYYFIKSEDDCCLRFACKVAGLPYCSFQTNAALGRKGMEEQVSAQ